MAREAGVLSPRARAARGFLTGYAFFIYLFLFAPIVLLVLIAVVLIGMRSDITELLKDKKS